MPIRRLILITAGLLALWLLWVVLLPSPGNRPPSTPHESGSWRVAEHTLSRLQDFQLEARVLGREDYYFDRGAKLSPTDLALGWGPMADPEVLRHISISQRNRWYFWRAEQLPIERRQIEINSANMHLIPATPAVASTLSKLKAGQQIRLTGQLVRVDGDDGYRWVSSLSREDTGDGACELIWVEQLQLLPDPL
ncbi:hypothetical protein OU997_15455 [Pseudomonas sp. SL4(2022)]|uniref:hypothetical protein n=1 Tax=Pseudomonas sp. SL4(2022) TaxID=2994661 RepID=UPI00226DA1C7|nr:hypothetical protein [Pseudomonas sp. SL4(2022)]WAC43649.1 hypothetical protein OU997_15455 [Pseudomonas sp. SL4(2022)]